MDWKTLLALVVKNLPASAADTEMGSIPGLGRSPRGRNGNPLRYSCLEKPHEQRCLAGVAKSQTRLSTCQQQQHNNTILILTKLIQIYKKSIRKISIVLYRILFSILILKFREKYKLVSKCQSTQLCPTLCGPKDCSPPGSSVHKFSRQGYQSGLPFPSPGDLNPGIEPGSPALQADCLLTELQGKPREIQNAQNILDKIKRNKINGIYTIRIKTYCKATLDTHMIIS